MEAGKLISDAKTDYFSNNDHTFDKTLSLPAKVYTSEKIFELELDHIFYKRWLAICHASRFAKPGDVVIRNIGNKSVIILMGDDRKIRAFHNVCRHRGTKLLADQETHVRAIQCPYHAWTYKLDGSLVGCPDMDTYFKDDSFNKVEYPLYPVKLEMWGGFVWINLDPKSESLLSYLADFPLRFDKYRTEGLKWISSLGPYEIRCNWKSMLENFNECYHCPTVHPETLKAFYREFRPADHTTIKGPYVMLQWKDCKWDGAPQKLTVGEELDLGEDRQMQWLPLVFPNFQFTFTPDWVMTLAVWPSAPDSLRLEIETYAYEWSATADYSEMLRIQDFVIKQDIEICQMQAAGLRSEVFEGCKFNALEESIYSFQKLYSDAMGSLIARS
ncbi:MAG: aromatic ring-hydroxylating dioxygenase subunit alpha [Thaumarchaeota archaeon]|nr:aromatic ring-hydroxylating dioxygenase subunit alpha [Nitrososphaerota archaeon]